MTVQDTLKTPESTSDEVQQYLILLRDLTWRVLEGAEEPQGLKKRFGHLLLERYPEQFQLPTAYLALLALLLDFENIPLKPLQLPSGATCPDLMGLWPEAQIPQPVALAELGSLWMILGVRLKNETLLYAGLKVAIWQSYLLDHLNLPHFSLWNPAHSFQTKKIGAYYYLLFSLAFQITSDSSFQKLAKLQQIFGWEESALPAKLLSLIPEKLSPPVPLFSRPLAEEITMGLLKFTTRDWSTACSLSGWNSGIFSFHKNQVSILNVGPQSGPLDSLEQFGIQRACHVTASRFREIIWDKSPYHFRLKGWTKLFALPTWMHLDFLYESQRITLTAHLQEGRPSGANLVFYLRSDQVILGGKAVFRVGGLEKYSGASVPLEFQTEGETIFLESQTDQPMQVIPLAGGEFFWGAHFLVAFPLGHEPFQCVIK